VNALATPQPSLQLLKQLWHLNGNCADAGG
jgi:hypothetical protein